MRRCSISRFFHLLIFPVLLFLVSCSQEIEETEYVQPPNVAPTSVLEVESILRNIGSTVEATIIGSVMDESYQPIEGAYVRIGKQSVVTDSKGFFSLTATMNSYFAHVKVEHRDYFTGAKSLTVEAGGLYQTQIVLVKNDQNVMASAGQSISIDELGMTFPEESVVVDGTTVPFTETFQLFGRYVGSSSEILVAQFPARLEGIDVEGKIVNLEPQGVFYLSAETEDREQLKVMQGTWVEVRLSINSEVSTIPLWYYDANFGVWVEEGELSKQGDVYVGSISKFATWAIATKVQSTYSVSFLVQDELQNPLSGIQVKIVSPNLGSGYTDVFGVFQVQNVNTAKGLTVAVINPLTGEESTVVATSANNQDTINMTLNVASSLILSNSIRGCYREPVVGLEYYINYYEETQPDDIFTAFGFTGEQGFLETTIVRDLQSTYKVSVFIGDQVINFTLAKNRNSEVYDLGDIVVCSGGDALYGYPQFSDIRLPFDDDYLTDVPKFRWSIDNEEELGGVSYNLYFGDKLTDLSLLAADLSESDYELGTPLQSGATYYWQVEAVAANGNVSKNEVFSFKVNGEYRYTGDITLSSQEEVNKFAGYSDIDGVLAIEGDDIRDLSPLNSLITVTKLQIKNNDKLTSLAGLDKLSVVDEIIVQNNPLLQSFDGLSSLYAITGDFRAIDNALLQDFCSLKDALLSQVQNSFFIVNGNYVNPDLGDVLNCP